MGVRLYFSNRLMPLAEKLQACLVPTAAGGDILTPPVVVVPNMNVSKWIKIAIARQTSIFMNVEFEFLESGLWRLIRSMASPSDAEPDLLDRQRLRILLFFILTGPRRDDDALVPVNRYLERRDEGASGVLELRGWQLAGELARLFQEYEYHRSDMIARWLTDHPPADAMEGCQKWLYRRVVSLKADLGRVIGRPMLTMTEYSRMMRTPEDRPNRSQGSLTLPRVHFFGFSQIPPLHIQLLSKLKDGCDIRIYCLNPSREYWEDIRTPVEKTWIARRQVNRLKLAPDELAAGELFSSSDHPLLSAWGKPGRESIRLFCQLTDYDFSASFAETVERHSVLSAITHGLLTLHESDHGQTPLSQDRSLQIVACPGIRREVETVYNSILYNLQTDPDLCMTDIAVMVTDMSRYKPVVDSVFDREPSRLTYNVVDASAKTESRFAQAVLAVMALARGSFSRKAVFDLLRNPCVMKRWDYGTEALTTWIHWADELGIYHGFDNPVTGSEVVPRAGLFSWGQGLERLRASRIMSTPMAAAGTPRAHFDGIVPYTDIFTGDERLLETFCTLISALHAAVASLRMESSTALGWREALFRVVDQFIAIPPDLRGEETVFQSLLNALERLSHHDVLMQIEQGRPLSAEALWAYVRDHLEGITGGQGDYLTGGVTVSGLMPMRPIPFKVVYVLGMEEGRFPGSTPEQFLDLRHRHRRIGDVTMAERNRYLFLEILISVGKKLYLSYISKDLQKDRDLFPCSVVHQLRRYVEQHVLGGQPFQVRHIPIQADSPHYLFPDAVNEWSDAMVNSSVARRISCYRRSGLWESFGEKATPDDEARIEPYCPDLRFPKRAPEIDPKATESLSIGLLRRFLIDPVAVVGAYHLGIAEQVDPTAEMAELADEPLSSRFPIDFEIRTAPVRNWLQGQLKDGAETLTLSPLAAEFEAVYADLTRKSRVPDGAFAVHDRSRMKEQVMAAGGTLYPLVLQMQKARRLYSAMEVGSVTDDAVEPGGVRFNCRPLTIQSSQGGASAIDRTVQLSGASPWVWQGVDGAWHCLVLTGSGRKPKLPDKHTISPLLTLMAISATGESCPWETEGRICLHVVYREHVLDLAYRLDPERCRMYLTGLVEDFFSPLPLLWMPFETLFSRNDWLALIEADRVDDVQRQAFFEEMTETLQNVLDPGTETAGATVTPDILDRARRRFRVFVPL